MSELARKKNSRKVGHHLHVHHTTTSTYRFDSRSEGGHCKNVCSHIAPLGTVVCTSTRSTCWSLARNGLFAFPELSTLATLRSWRIELAPLLVAHATKVFGIRFESNLNPRLWENWAGSKGNEMGLGTLHNGGIIRSGLRDLAQGCHQAERHIFAPSREFTPVHCARDSLSPSF